MSRSRGGRVFERSLQVLVSGRLWVGAMVVCLVTFAGRSLGLRVPASDLLLVGLCTFAIYRIDSCLEERDGRGEILLVVGAVALGFTLVESMTAIFVSVGLLAVSLYFLERVPIRAPSSIRHAPLKVVFVAASVSLVTWGMPFVANGRLPGLEREELLFGFSLFLICSTNVLLSDLRDMDDDRSRARCTSAIALGQNRALAFCRTLTLIAGGALALLPFAKGGALSVSAGAYGILSFVPHQHMRRSAWSFLVDAVLGLPLVVLSFLSE